MNRKSLPTVFVDRNSPARGLIKRASLDVPIVWAIVGVVGFFTLSGSSTFFATTVLIYSVFALSTNVLFGWTGVTSFGQAAFFGIGAYTLALLGKLDLGIAPPLLILLGGVIAAIFALFFSLISSRVTGTQFAMLTLVFGQILWLLLFRVPWLGGENGISGIPRGSLLGMSLFNDKTFWVYALVITGVLAWMLRVLHRSSLGASLTAVRDDPLRAAALGINVKFTRGLAFVIAGAFGGFAGALYSQQQGIASTELMSWMLSGQVLVMCLVGGLRLFWGPVIGAVLLTLLNQVLRNSIGTPELFVGLILLAVVLVLPGGLGSLWGKAVAGWRAKSARTYTFAKEA